MHPSIKHLQNHALNHPEEIGYVAESAELTYSQLLGLVQSIAQTMRDAGIIPGQLVASTVHNDLAWPVALAFFHEGVVGTHLGNGSLRPGKEVEWELTDSTNPRPNGSGNIVVLAQKIADPPTATSSIQPHPMTSMDDLAWISYTSGTTGSPKAVGFTIAELHHTPIRAEWEPSAENPQMSFYGIASSVGLKQAMLALSNKFPVILLSPLSKKIADVVPRFGVEILAGSPIQLTMTYQEFQSKGLAPLTGIKVVRTGGSSPNPRVVQSIATLFPNARYFSTYASTEVGVISRVELGPNANPFKLGKPFPHITVQAVGPDSEPVEPGVVGRLRFKTDRPPKRYLYNTGSSVEAIEGDWFYSGDLGSVDETGEITLAGRKDDVVNLGGEKISLAKVDAFAMTLEGVEDAACFVVQHKTGIPVLAMAFTGPKSTDSDAVGKRLNKEFGFESPRVLVQVSAIPRTDTGKVLRRVLAQTMIDSLKKNQN
jgi:acyl-coenzyme A synthetase/AMP-(fatty) acid ligase